MLIYLFIYLFFWLTMRVHGICNTMYLCVPTFIYLFFCLFIPPHYYLRYAIAKDTNIVLYMSSQLGYTFRKKGKT